MTNTTENPNLVVEKGQRLYNTCLQKGDSNCVTEFVSHELGKPGCNVVGLEEYLAWLHEQRGILLRLKHVPLTDSERMAAQQRLTLTNVVIEDLIFQLYGLHNNEFA